MPGDNPVQTDTEVPLSPAGGSSASGNGHSIDMESRVAFYREQLEESIRQGEEQASGRPLTSLDDLDAIIKAADAKHERLERARVEVPNAAPVRRKGEPPPPQPTPPVAEKPKRKYTKSAARQVVDMTDEELLAWAGVERYYSTKEVAEFFDRTPQWVYWGLGKKGHEPVFIDPEGRPIVPQRIGEGPNARRRFTLPVIKDILLSCHRRGNVEPDELKKILRRIRVNELGGEWRNREGWHLIGNKWYHPDKCQKVKGKWVRKPSGDEDDRDDL